MKLKFEILKTQWEHHRATIFNYALWLITLWIFGSKYFVVDKWDHYNEFAVHSLSVIIGLSFVAGVIIVNRMKKVDGIRKEMKRIIGEDERKWYE